MKRLQLLLLALLPLMAYGQQANKWIQYYNAVGLDRWGRCVTTDASGNTFATGQVLINPFQQDIVTVKYDSLGKEVWVYTQSGPKGQCNPTKTITDNAGNLYVLGTSTSGTTLNIVYKLSPAGTKLWIDTIKTQTPTGAYGSVLNDMTFNSNGDIVVAGGMEGFTVAGYPYWFIATINTSGVETWRNLTAVDYAYNDIYSIAAGPGGVMYAAGHEVHGNPPGERHVIRKYSATGTIAWQLVYDADSTNGENEVANCIRTDASGNLYVLGYASFNGRAHTDYLLRKYDVSGNLIWSKTYSSVSNGGNDVGRFLYVMPSGESYAYGTVEDEVHLVKFDASGNIMWARPYRYNASNATYVGGLDVDPATGNVVISGTERRSSGMIAGFAAKFKSNGDSMWVKHLVKYGEGAQVHIGADHSVYMVSTGYNAMQTLRITDADITLKKNLTGTGLYDFNDPTKKTGVKLDSTNTGAGDVSVMLLLNQVANTNWCTGTNAPLYASNYRWVVESGLASFVLALITFDLTSLTAGLGGPHGMTDPSKYSIYQRPLDGEGEFCKLITTYANGALSARITHLSEFFIGSETDSFNYKPPVVLGVSNSISKGTLAMQLSPNPAASYTNLNFTLNQPGNVALMVYDVTGRKVQAIPAQSMSAGTHDMKIDLAEMKNGIYFCKLVVDGSAAETIKLTVSN